MKKYIWTFLVLFFSLVSLQMPFTALALSNDDLNSLYNDTAWYKTGGSCSVDTNLVGSDNVQKAFNFLIGKGKDLSALQAAAVIGNLEQESGQGLNPLAQQNPAHVGILTPIPGEGFGIAQWTDPGRQQGLVDFAQTAGGQPGDLSIQLNYLWQELSTNYPGAYSQIRSDTDIVVATTDFMNGYEGPGKPHLDNRISNAKAALALYGGAGAATASGGSGGCVVCNNSNPGTASLSSVRQNVVCLAQQELATWKSQPGYGKPFPGFAYAASGYLKYSDKAPEEWCADFVSWIYNQANYPLTGGTSGGWRVSGVLSIQALGQADKNFHWHEAGSGYAPKPGDIAIMPTHTNIFVSFAAGTSQYIGGDQGDGPYPGGSIVSQVPGNGYYDNGIIGYVSPD